MYIMKFLINVIKDYFYKILRRRKKKNWGGKKESWF